MFGVLGVPEHIEVFFVTDFIFGRLPKASLVWWLLGPIYFRGYSFVYY